MKQGRQKVNKDDIGKNGRPSIGPAWKRRSNRRRSMTGEVASPPRARAIEDWNLDGAPASTPRAKAKVERLILEANKAALATEARMFALKDKLFMGMLSPAAHLVVNEAEPFAFQGHYYRIVAREASKAGGAADGMKAAAVDLDTMERTGTVMRCRIRHLELLITQGRIAFRDNVPANDFNAALGWCELDQGDMLA